jgi:hypothetical protein
MGTATILYWVGLWEVYVWSGKLAKTRGKRL